MSDYLNIFKNLNVEGEYSRTSHYLEVCGSESTTSSLYYQLDNAGKEMTQVRMVARVLRDKQYDLWKQREHNHGHFTKGKVYSQLLRSMTAEIIVAKYLSDVTGYDVDRFYPKWFKQTEEEVHETRGAFTADIYLDDNTEIQVKCKRKSDPGIILQNKCGRKYKGHQSNILNGNVGPNYFLCAVEYSNPVRNQHLYRIMYMVRTVDIYNNRTHLFDKPRNGNPNKVQVTDSKLMNLMGMKLYRPKVKQYVPSKEDFPALVSDVKRKPFKNKKDLHDFLRDTIIKSTNTIIKTQVEDISWGDAAMESDYEVDYDSDDDRV